MTEDLIGYAVLPLNSLISTSFSIRSSEDLELDDLTESIRAYGVLEPIVVRASKEEGMFEIVMGERRVKAARKAGLREIPAIVRKLSDEETAVLQLIENLQRKDLTDEETTASLAFLAKLTTWPPKMIAERLKRSYTWVLLHLPDEFKDKEKAKAGQKGGEAKSLVELDQSATKIVAQVTQAELEIAEKAARLHRTQCKNPACLRFVPDDEIIYVGDSDDKKPYCRSCAPAFSMTYEKEKKRLERLAAEKEKPLSTKSFDTAEEREARMHTHDSQFQQEVFVELASEGLTFEQNQKLPVFETEPDGLRYLNEERTQGLLVYLDNVEVHKGKRLDTDDRLRETYGKHHPGITILSIPYKGKSDKEKARVKALIREKYEFLKSKKLKPEDELFADRIETVPEDKDGGDDKAELAKWPIVGAEEEKSEVT